MSELEKVTFDASECLFVDGKWNPPARVKVVRPKDDQGVERDQSEDAGNNIRHASTLGLVPLPLVPAHAGSAIICGGGPSIKSELETIRKLAANPDNAVFALNWTHNWLIENGIQPKGCVFFEIDAEPDSILGAADPSTIYFVCSHCHPKTFEQLLAKVPHHNVILWHRPPDCLPMVKAMEEAFPGDNVYIGGGVSTFLNTVSLSMALGYYSFDVFGVDSSFPDDAESTHVEGYPSIVKPDADGIVIYAKDQVTNQVKRFKTVGYLLHQVEEFKAYCARNHQNFSMRVHGEGLLPFVHRSMYSGQYT